MGIRIKGLDVTGNLGSSKRPKYGRLERVSLEVSDLRDQESYVERIYRMLGKTDVQTLEGEGFHLTPPPRSRDSKYLGWYQNPLEGG